MTEAERLEEYRICKRRGHSPRGLSITMDWDTWDICEFCATNYRYEQQVIESNPPREDAS